MPRGWDIGPTIPMGPFPWPLAQLERLIPWASPRRATSTHTYINQRWVVFNPIGLKGLTLDQEKQLKILQARAVAIIAGQKESYRRGLQNVDLVTLSERRRFD